MVKIGVISDVHGNLNGLERALRLLQNDLAVDEVVCTGDLVDKGLAGGAVIAQIREHNIPTVLGNHDRSAPNVERGLRDNPHLRDVYGTPPLDDDALAYLESLPETLRFERAGVTVLMAHGAPWDVARYIKPNALPNLKRRVAAESEADVTLLGHTHEPMIVAVGEHLILNSGSVSAVYGRVHGGRRTCAVLELPSKRFTVYDVDTAEALRIPTIKQPPSPA